MSDNDAIRERLAALDDEPLSMKWNYSEYAMIRNTNTGRAIANVFAKPYDTFYFHAPADIRSLLAENAALRDRLAAAEGMMKEASTTLMLAPEGSREWEYRCSAIKRRISAYLDQHPAPAEPDGAETGGGA